MKKKLKFALKKQVFTSIAPIRNYYSHTKNKVPITKTVSISMNKLWITDFDIGYRNLDRNKFKFSIKKGTRVYTGTEIVSVHDVVPATFKIKQYGHSKQKTKEGSGPWIQVL